MAPSMPTLDGEPAIRTEDLRYGNYENVGQKRLLDFDIAGGVYIVTLPLPLQI